MPAWNPCEARKSILCCFATQHNSTIDLLDRYIHTDRTSMKFYDIMVHVMAISLVAVIMLQHAPVAQCKSTIDVKGKYKDLLAS